MWSSTSETLYRKPSLDLTILFIVGWGQEKRLQEGEAIVREIGSAQKKKISFHEALLIINESRLRSAVWCSSSILHDGRSRLVYVGAVSFPRKFHDVVALLSNDVDPMSHLTFSPRKIFFLYLFISEIIRRMKNVFIYIRAKLARPETFCQLISRQHSRVGFVFRAYKMFTRLKRAASFD